MADETIIKFIYILAKFLTSYVAAVVAVIGIFLNVFSIYVFRKGDHGRAIPAIHYYLTTLLLWQSGVLANIFLHALPVFIWKRPLPFASYFPVYIGNIYFTITTSIAAVWVLVALTLDRYFALCCPIKHRLSDSRRQAKKKMIIISIATLLFAIPQIFETTMTENCERGAKNETICVTSPAHTALAKNNLYWIVYRVFLNFSFISIGPCIVLCVLTTKISMALNEKFKERRHLLAENVWSNDEVHRNKEFKANLLLVIIIAKSTLCSVQPSLFAVLRLIIGEAEFRGPYVGIWYYINDFITELDYATNFPVFIIFGKMFRVTCKNIIADSFVGKILKMKSEEKGSKTGLSGRTNATNVA